MAGALLGMFTITGMAGSYVRMVWKVARFNELRSEKKALQTQYKQLEKVSHEKDVQVASLGSLANEVSVIYGLKPNPKLMAEPDKPMQPEQVKYTIDQLYALRSSALDRYRDHRAWPGTDPHGDAQRMGAHGSGSDLVAGYRPHHQFLRRAYRPVQR